MAKNMYQKREERKQNRLNNDEQGGFKKTVINWYPGHMAKSRKEIIEKMKLVDIVLEVLDARMPYSSRIKDIDLMAQNKPHLIVMSKADLCDMTETKKWVKKFESEGKRVILTNLMDPKEVQKEVLKSIDIMMNHQNNKREDRGMLKKIPRVLVVGIPNVGKSTLINALVGRKAAGVGNTPGVTRQLSWIRVQNHIDLLDTPGILYPRIDNKKVGFNLASFSSIKETILPVEDVAWYILKELSKYYPDILLERYGIDDMDNDYDEIYMSIATKRGFFKKGGVVDYDRANATILSDIRSGNISGITFDRCINE